MPEVTPHARGYPAGLGGDGGGMALRDFLPRNFDVAR